MSVAGKNLALTIDIAMGMWYLDGDAASERHVTLAVQQALASHVDRHERSGAGGLHTYARPAKTQLIGHTRCQYVLIVPGLPDQKEPGTFHQVAVIDQIVDHVGAQAGPGKERACQRRFAVARREISRLAE